MNNIFKNLIFTGVFIMLNYLIMSAQPTYGIFENGKDIGNVKHNGFCSYDSMSENYYMKGSGKNMWLAEDEFYFVYKKVKGNFILYSWLEWIGKGVEPHRKAGLIIRESLKPGSRYVTIANHGDGLISMQFRTDNDSVTKEFQFPYKSYSILQLEKDENKISASVAEIGKTLQKVGELEMSFDSTGFYIGLFVCSHNPDVTEEARFFNTRLTIPAKKDFAPYKDYIGSRLEILDIESGLRKVIYQSTTPFEAPNWSRDGKFLVFNSNGLLYKISSDGGKPELINTDFADTNNNDHGISPDGKQLVISHHSKNKIHNENSVIYTLPISGGIPKQITEKSPSYWHGWSPDGKYLIYTAKRNNQWDIYRIPATGGEEKQLTDNTFLNDGSEYSTDGNYIWFNSNRTATMEIWRMNQDGSEQTQITNGGFQNWFAHQSPDGKQLIILSYPPEVNSGEHPYYKHVMLRLMNVGEFNPKVIAHLYGGQGTINVPSWSPDSKKVAFVSNTDGLNAVVK
jgi:Tol biopolymer transport system component